jgi:hypothetical protein
MQRKRSKKNRQPRQRTRITTSLMELMQELTKLTQDDNLVMGTMKSIFGSYRVRLASAPVSVRLVGSGRSPRVFRHTRFV